MKCKYHVHWVVVGLTCLLFATFGCSDESISEGNDSEVDFQVRMTAAQQGDAEAQ